MGQGFVESVAAFAGIASSGYERRRGERNGGHSGEGVTFDIADDSKLVWEAGEHRSSLLSDGLVLLFGSGELRERRSEVGGRFE